MIPSRIRDKILSLEHFQDFRKDFHPEPNVRNHLGQVCTLALQAEEDFDVAYAALLHDIGKDSNCKKKWAQHAYRGSEFIAPDVPPKVRWLVENHMRVFYYVEGTMRAEKRQAFEQHPWFDDLMRLHRYDKGGVSADGKHMPWDEIYSALDELDYRKNEAIIMVGIQASGKSTIAKAIVTASRPFDAWFQPEWERSGRDDIRLMLGIGPGSWRHQETCAIHVQRNHLRMALGRGQGIIVDNCHNTKKRRRDMLEWLRAEFPGIKVKALLVYAPLDVCIERNSTDVTRHQVPIPADTLKAFHGDLLAGFGGKMNDERVVKQLLEEGFDEAEIKRTA